MSKHIPDTLRAYIDSPEGSLTIERMDIGRVRFRNLLVHNREGALQLESLMDRACLNTRRPRKAGSRYPEPLPMGSPARLLSVEIADYIQARELRNLERDTIDATARTLQLLLIACGDIDVSRVDHSHIYRLWNLLRWAPPGITSDPALKGKSADELMDLGKALAVPSPAGKTFDRHRRFLSTFFTVLEKSRAIPCSPMAAFGEMKKDLVEDADKPVHYFNDADLQKIFDPTAFVPWARKYPHRWWCPMICLYTGVRSNEAAQLKITDIIDERGTWCIAIRKTVDADLKGHARTKTRQRLKGKSAIRTLPIPQALIDAGFLEFVEDMKAWKKHPRLFPHLSAGMNQKTGETNGRYGQGFTSQFCRYLQQLGFPKGIGSHAFRHTLATDLHNQGIQLTDIAAVTGHSAKHRVPVLEDHYIHPLPQAVRARQKSTLVRYQPNVTLPKYKRGQFKASLADGYRLHP